jgi:hypothetical protein
MVGIIKRAAVLNTSSALTFNASSSALGICKYSNIFGSNTRAIVPTTEVLWDVAFHKSPIIFTVFKRVAGVEALDLFDFVDLALVAIAPISRTR